MYYKHIQHITLFVTRN